MRELPQRQLRYRMCLNAAAGNRLLHTLPVLIRRAVYWTSLLALVVAWFTLTSADGTAACRAAAPPPRVNEFGTDGISFLPPGYKCMYIDGRNTVEPLDAAGWVEWSNSVGILVLLVYGAMSFVVRIGRRVTGWPSPAHD